MQKNINKNKSTARNIIYAILIVLLVALIIRIIFFFGPDRRDSLLYGQAAYNLFHGQYFSGNVFFAIGRLPLIAPTGFFYKLFGVNDFTSTLISLLASLGSIFLTYKIGMRFGNKFIAIIAASLMAVNALDIQYATQLLPDSINSFLMTAVVFSWIIAVDSCKLIEERKKSIFYFVLTGIILALLYYTRINSVLIIPVLLGYLIGRKKWSFLPLITLGILILMFLGGGIIFWLKTGNFFFIENMHLGYVDESVSRSKSILSKTSLFGIGSSIQTIIHNIILWPWFVAGSIGVVVVFISRNAKKFWFSIFWFFALWLVYEIYFSLGFSVALDRYLNVLLVPLAIIIASATWTIYFYWNNINKITLFIKIVLLSSMAMLIMMPFPILYKQKQNFGGGRYCFRQTKMASKVLKKYPKKRVIVSPNYWIGCMNYRIGYDTGVNLFKESTIENKGVKLTSVNQYLNMLPVSSRDSSKKIIDVNNAELKDNYFIIWPRQTIIDYSNLYHIAGAFKMYDLYYSQGDEKKSIELSSRAKKENDNNHFLEAYNLYNDAVMYDPNNKEALDKREYIRFNYFNNSENGNIARSVLNTYVLSSNNFKKGKDIDNVVDSVWREYGIPAVQDDPEKDISFTLDFKQERKISHINIIWGKVNKNNTDIIVVAGNDKISELSPDKVDKSSNGIDLYFKDVSTTAISLIIKPNKNKTAHNIKDLTIY